MDNLLRILLSLRGSEHSVNAESVTPNGEFAFAGTSDNGAGNHVFAPVAAETKGIDAGLAEIFEEFPQAAEDRARSSGRALKPTTIWVQPTRDGIAG